MYRVTIERYGGPDPDNCEYDRTAVATSPEVGHAVGVALEMFMPARLDAEVASVVLTIFEGTDLPGTEFFKNQGKALDDMTSAAAHIRDGWDGLDVLCSTRESGRDTNTKGHPGRAQH